MSGTSLGGCPTGEARLTAGYRLSAPHVIHTVGPIWRGGGAGERQSLENCYRSCLAIARRRGFRDIAFPAIATGIYGLPGQEAAEIDVATVISHLARHRSPELIIFVCFDPATLEAYRKALGKLALMPASAFAADTVSGEVPQMSVSEASNAAALSDAQKAAVEDVVRHLLTAKEPDLVVKAAQEMRRRQEAESASKNQAAVTGNHDQLFADPTAPVGGNPNGDVTVVEFFDYQCSYCKMTQEAVSKLLDTDKNVKLIYKEYPILGPDSIQGSKAALASVKQGKYMKFHDTLMNTKGHLSSEIILTVAKETGLDVEKLKEDMADDSIERTMHANVVLAGDIGARGTPAFVIGEQMFGGAMKYEQMQQAVEDARQKQRK
jgi:protein-disulfide isomerase